MQDVLDILLKRKVDPVATKEVKHIRLSKELGQDVVFKLKGLGYSRVAELKQMGDEMQIHILLAGVTEPSFKSKELMALYEAPTPAELVKKLLTPGEIEDLSRQIEILSGFRKETVEEIKKK